MAHPLSPTSPLPENSATMGEGYVGANGCAIGGNLLGVSGPHNSNKSSIWVEKRLRNGSETARGTAEIRPSPRQALLLEIKNDRGELHFHRTRHRRRRALPVPGCLEGRLISRVRFGRRPSRSHADGALKFKKTNLQNTFLLAESTKATVGTDSCRGTVPMEPPMSINNGSMRHREPIK